MAKIALLLTLTLLLNAQNSEALLQKNCLNCHNSQQLPSSLMYKKYLMKYSTKNRVKNAIFNYLKNPKVENSVLPKQFFIKFQIKKPLELSDSELNKSIEAFIDKFDIKKKLFIPKR